MNAPHNAFPGVMMKIHQGQATPAPLNIQDLRVLVAHIEKLKARNAQLEYIVGMGPDLVTQIRASTGMSHREAQVLGVLFKRDEIGFEGLTMCLWGHKPFCDQPIDPKGTIKTTICKIRKVLDQYGIKIGTRWGDGHYMTKENKARLQALLDQPQ